MSWSGAIQARWDQERGQWFCFNPGVIELPDRKLCQECKGTGTFESGVCHCGEPMEGYHDDHSPVEMIGDCPYCEPKAG